MKSGDPKKVAVLSVVALLVIGMAVFRLIPQGQPRRPTSAAKAEKVSDVSLAAIAAIQKPPQELSKDPFIHPSLRIDKRDAVRPKEQPAAKSALPGAGIPGLELGGGIGAGDPGEIVAPIRPDPGLFTGPDQQSKKGAAPRVQRTIMVEAIITVDRPRAFIRLDGKESIPCSEGDVLVGAGKVLAISESAVTIQTAKTTKKLIVGKESKL